jgi:hypothetical protein
VRSNPGKHFLQNFRKNNYLQIWLLFSTLALSKNRYIERYVELTGFCLFRSNHFWKKVSMFYTFLIVNPLMYLHSYTQLLSMCM